MLFLLFRIDSEMTVIVNTHPAEFEDQLAMFF